MNTYLKNIFYYLKIIFITLFLHNTIYFLYFNHIKQRSNSENDLGKIHVPHEDKLIVNLPDYKMNRNSFFKYNYKNIKNKVKNIFTKTPLNLNKKINQIKKIKVVKENIMTLKKDKEYLKFLNNKYDNIF